MAFSFTLSSFSPSHSSYSTTTTTTTTMSKSAFLNSMGVKPQQCLPSSTLSISPSLVHLQSPKPKLSLAPPESRTTHSYTSVVKCSRTHTWDIIERFTVFETNPANTPGQNKSFIKELNNLDSGRKPKTSHISAGEVTNKGANIVYLHTRFDSLKDMNFFLTTPKYLALQKGSLVSLCSKETIYQWNATTSDVDFPPDGNAIRATFFKLDSNSDKNIILQSLDDLSDTNGSILELTFGETFDYTGANTPPDHADVATGYISSLMVFPDIDGMHSVDSDSSVQQILASIAKLTKNSEVYEYTLP